MKTNAIMGLLLALALSAARPAPAAQYNSGSSGLQGPFPPTSPPGGTTGMTLNLNDGTVTYAPSGTTATVLNVPLGGFSTGVFHFTSITLPAGITLTFLKHPTNPPITFLATGDATLAGTISLNGSNGGDALTSTATAPNGGAGGPGGYPGGAGGTNVPPASANKGGAGAGPGGGTGGSYNSSYPFNCGGGGGGYGAAATTYTHPTACPNPPYAGVGGPAYGNPALLPLLGGSGGGGGSGVFGYTGAGGGGGGGALLLAVNGTLTFSGILTATGGNGGAPINSPITGAGAGGAGGGVRLAATTLTGSGGQITVNGGSVFSPSFYAGPGAGGRIRLEAYTLTATIAFSTAPSLSPLPGSATLANNPTLTLTSLGGVSAPPNPGAAFGSPDIVVPGPGTSVSVVVTAANIPTGAGTALTLVVTPQMGAATSVSTTLSSPTTTVPNVPIFADQPFRVDAQVTYALSAALDSPIKYAGEAVTTATVTASLGGDSTVRYFTASGQEVPADAVAALGLPR